MSGLDIDTRSDIYSLGVLLYELLVGKTPFDGKELMQSGLDEMRRTIREKEPVRPSTRLSSLNKEELTTTAKRRHTDAPALIHQLKGDLDWIAMKCLEKDRTRRYDTATGLAIDVQRFLGNEPVSARPPSQVYRFRKMIRRNRGIAAAAAGIMLALIVGLTVSTVLYLRERESFQRMAAAEREQARLRQAEETLRQQETELRERAQKGEEAAQKAAAARRQTVYVADMAVVKQAIEEGNLGRARMLLNRYRPQPDEPDIRGFEWRHLWLRAQSDESAKLGRHSGLFGGIAFSPDGVYLANTTPDGIEIRSFHNRTLLLTLTNGGNEVLKFSPDSRFLLASVQNKIRRWDVRNWTEQMPLDGLSAPFAFAQGGRALVGLEVDHLAVWSTENWQRVGRLPGKANPSVHSEQSLAVSPDGTKVFFGGGRISSWDLDRQIELEPIVPNFGGGIIPCLAISGENLVSTHWWGVLNVWNTRTHQLHHTFESHLAWVPTVVFSPDGSLLASGSADQTIVLYDVKNLKVVRRLKGHEGEIWALQFSPDGKWLASGSDFDGTLRLWEVNDRSENDSSFEGNSLQFDTAGQSLIYATREGELRRLDLRSGKSDAFTPNAFGAKFGLGTAMLGARSCLSPDLTRVANISAAKGEVEIWRVLDGRKETTLTNPTGSIQAITFSHDGQFLALAGPGAETRLWRVTDWTSERLHEPSSDTVSDLSFSRDGSRLVKAGGSVKVMDTAKKRVVLHIEQGEVASAALSPDGKILALGTIKNLIEIWDVEAENKLGTLRGHVAAVFGLAFSSDGRTLASCADQSAKLWSIETLQEILTLNRLRTPTAAPLFSADGRWLVTRSVDSHFHIWRAPSFAEIEAMK